MNARGTRIDWAVFLALGFMWGSSYLFIKLAVDDFGTFTLVALRLRRRRPPAVGRRPPRPPTAAARSPHLRPPPGHGDHQHHDPVPAHHLGRAIGRILARRDPDLARPALRDRPVGDLPRRRTDARQRRRRAHRRLHRRRHHHEPRADRIRLVGHRRDRPAGRGVQLRLRRGLLATERPRPRADDPGGLPGDLRGDHHRQRSRSCSSTHGRQARTPRRSSPSCGSASSARVSPTWRSSGCSRTGARRGRRSSPTSSRSSGSRSATSSSRSPSTRGSCSGPRS